MMRFFAILAICTGLSGCSDTEPKTGLMPGIANGGYDAPSNAEASAAFMAAFQARYDIPELDYPDHIKIRIRNARMAKLQEDMQKAAKRQELMAKLALAIKARKDPEAKRLLDEMKANAGQPVSPKAMGWMADLMDAQPQRSFLSDSEREEIYQSAIKAYKKSFRNLEIENCRWTEMTRLIGSGHEELAAIHGEHPTHGFQCVGEMKTEARKGYPRHTSFRSFWVKAPSGEWKYYGQFKGVGIAPRLQALDPRLLNTPEETIARQKTFEMITSQLK